MLFLKKYLVKVFKKINKFELSGKSMYFLNNLIPSEKGCKTPIYPFWLGPYDIEDNFLPSKHVKKATLIKIKMIKT